MLKFRVRYRTAIWENNTLSYLVDHLSVNVTDESSNFIEAVI